MGGSAGPSPEAERRRADVLSVHYHRPCGDYGGWSLWTWKAGTGEAARDVRPSGRDAFGVLYRFPLAPYGAGSAVGLLPHREEWSRKDGPDRIWHPTLGGEVWIVSGRPDLHPTLPDVRPRVERAWLDAPDRLHLDLSHPVRPRLIRPGKFRVLDAAGSRVGVLRAWPEDAVSGGQEAKGPAPVTLLLARDLDLRGEAIHRFTVSCEDTPPAAVVLRRALDGPAFRSSAPLGAIPQGSSTWFRVFAPTASSVDVLLCRAPRGGPERRLPLRPAAGGAWELRVDEDLTGWYYSFLASGLDPRFDSARELHDPYARCVTTRDGRGLVLPPTKPPPPAPALEPSEAILYELHLRDFTIDPDSGVERRGKYAGLTEPGRVLAAPGRARGRAGPATGLDHLVELGVTAVQIMPVQLADHDDASDDYTWGYMPVHFSSPTGWYASGLEGDERVRELKDLVAALHARGIRVVLDVVYNHTAEVGARKVFGPAGLVPGYYYRLDSRGGLANGSGCGNELRTEAPMVRRLLVDTLRRWVVEYGVDGFRFDLMGLIDLSTLRSAVRELRSIRPDLLLYGEPWTSGPTPIRPTLKGMQRGEGFAVFNDRFRDALAGDLDGGRPGFVQKGWNVPAVKEGIRGSIRDFARDPVESVNYVECHDDRTLWDRLVLTTAADPGVDDRERARMHRLASAVLLTSQGIPFLHAGQEMLRTKGGVANSHDGPDAVNMIRWRWKREHEDVVRYVAGLVRLRRAHPLFRMRTRREVESSLRFLDEEPGVSFPEGCVGYRLTPGRTGDAWKEILVLLNPRGEDVHVSVPEGEWTAAVNDREAGDSPVGSGVKGARGGRARVARRSALVLFR